jgi:hypothetical protein
VLSFQDREGMDVDVVRAVRLWYSPAAAELAIDLKPEENESRLGVGISCTEEVFNPFFHLWPSLFLDISFFYIRFCAAKLNWKSDTYSEHGKLSSMFR